MTPDPTTSRAFYQAIFGWQFDGTDTDSIALVNDRPVCGVWSDDAELGQGLSYWHVYLEVSDLHSTLARARQPDGTVLWGPTDYRGVAAIATLRDPAGATFSVWQSATPGEFLTDVAGASSWTELVTEDPVAIVDFYRQTLELEPASAHLGDRSYRLFIGDDRPIAGVVQSATAAHWRTYFLVTDLAATLDTATAAGGTVASSPCETLIGTTAFIRDPHGALLGLREQRKTSGKSRAPDDNAGFPITLDL
ncbi:VOC family protein [Gordonia sp. CPCC 206044]|uniref:VOC family protein n=1 Tax=Gordonia sp. CPCC 206044 TaxID=3140793 RepID=UPI003AF3FAED